MNTQNDKLNILVVGATGILGSLITKYCLEKPNLQVNILIRNPQKNPELVSQVEKAGGKVIVGDLFKPETIKDCTKGMHTVVSAVNSLEDERVFLDCQIALVDDCVRNKVERFVPSDYGINYYNFTKEELSLLPFGKAKYAVHEFLKKQPIKTLDIWPGQVIESLFSPVFKGLGYWGDVNHKYEMTSYDDCARITAAAVTRKDKTGDVVFISNVFDLNEVSAIYNQVRGISITPKKLGSIEDLRQAHEEKKKAGDEIGTLFLGIHLMIQDEKAKFNKNDANEFPEVKPTSLEQFLKQHPEMKIPE